MHISIESDMTFQTGTICRSELVPGAIRLVGLITLFLVGSAADVLAQANDRPRPTRRAELQIPHLEEAPEIDGDLSDWRNRAHHDGVWDIHRIRSTFWYDGGRRNRLTDHGEEADPRDDLRGRYYTAWDGEYLYFGVEATDNVNDVSDPSHAPSRWHHKDAVCWFIEAPVDEAPEWFARGDNGFCFVADEEKPAYGAWWRHGTASESYVEEPIPEDAVDYAIRVDPQDEGSGDFVLEARVRMEPTLGVSDPDWEPPAVGDTYGVEIVHTDPDGGGYGGHFMIHGTGDDDATWGRAVLVGSRAPVERRPE